MDHHTRISPTVVDVAEHVVEDRDENAVEIRGSGRLRADPPVDIVRPDLLQGAVLLRFLLPQPVVHHFEFLSRDLNLHGGPETGSLKQI